MSKEIIVDPKAISKAICELNNQLDDLKTQKSNIKKLSFYASDYTGRKSRGPCALQMQNLTYEDLKGTADSMECLIKSTISFLEKAKEKAIEVDETLSTEF